MSASFLKRLQEGRLLLDGAMGTTLAARGGVPLVRVALCNLESPDVVRGVHLDFLDAGCELIQTNTFAANALSLARVGAADRVQEVHRQAVRIARASVKAAGHGFVAGNIGPVAAYAAVTSPPSADQLAALYREQAQAQLEEGVDLFSLETISDLEEARIAIDVLRELSPLPITACVTMERSENEWRTLSGVSVAAALVELESVGCAAVGINCAFGSADLLQAWPRIADYVHVPLIAKPNAGLPRVTSEGLEFDQSPAQFAADMQRIAALGAAAVGGCCGADPRFLKELNALLS